VPLNFKLLFEPTYKHLNSVRYLKKVGLRRLGFIKLTSFHNTLGMDIHGIPGAGLLEESDIYKPTLTGCSALPFFLSLGLFIFLFPACCWRLWNRLLKL